MVPEYQTNNLKEARKLKKLGFNYKKKDKIYVFEDSNKLEQARKQCQK